MLQLCQDITRIILYFYEFSYFSGVKEANIEIFLNSDRFLGSKDSILLFFF